MTRVFERGAWLDESMRAQMDARARYHGERIYLVLFIMTSRASSP